jgi:malonyl-CoA/methylmalonyl-CoA synthetase
VGRPLPGVSARIADPVSGAVLEDGAIGMIEVHGPNVFSGYWGMPERMESDFRGDGYFITGDLGRVDENGYFHIVGRGKDLVISGGYNVYPKEVEAEIDAIEGVTESAVIGIPHPDFGEGVVATVVRDAGSSIDEQHILKALKDRLAGFKQPKQIIFVPELPRNALGKVQKNVLRASYRALFDALPPDNLNPPDMAAQEETARPAG